MIPTLGLMIAGYIVLRCLEMVTVRDDHWSTKFLGIVMRILAMLTLVGTVYFASELVRSGADVGSRFPTP
jgi:uncharacterized membrane protein